MNHERLYKIYDHLKNGGLGHDKFNFGDISNFMQETVQQNVCGSAGCAVGEFPFIFPEKFKFGAEGSNGIFTSVIFKGAPFKTGTSYCKIAKWLDIPESAVSHIFDRTNKTYVYGGTCFNSLFIEDITPQMVAQQIEDFINFCPDADFEGTHREKSSHE